MATLNAIVPIRTSSTRLPDKNFLGFDAAPLYRVILGKLEQVPQVNKIYVNTDSEIIEKECPVLFEKVVIIKRAPGISAPQITMNDIIRNDLPNMEGEHFLQTHVTNPLLSKNTITKAIDQYFSSLKAHDSLFTAEKIKKRVYAHNGKPVNHSNGKLEQTQDLDEVFVENSNLFIFSRKSFIEANNSRIGKKPMVFPMNMIEGIDIDYSTDLALAALIHQNRKMFDFLDQ